jgi:hypothetical protein
LFFKIALPCCNLLGKKRLQAVAIFPVSSSAIIFFSNLLAHRLDKTESCSYSSIQIWSSELSSSQWQEDRESLGCYSYLLMLFLRLPWEHGLVGTEHCNLLGWNAFILMSGSLACFLFRLIM